MSKLIAIMSEKESKPLDPKKLIIEFIKRLLLTIMILVPLLSYIGTTYLIQANTPLEKQPWVHWSGLDPHSEVFISWETEAQTDAIIKYGFSPSELSFETNSTELSQMHRMKLTGLPMDTKIYYQVSDSGGNYLSRLQSFRTAPNSSVTTFKSFNVTFVADTQQFMGTGHWDTISKAIDGFGDSDFLGIAGDVGQTEDDQETWNFFWKQAERVTDRMPIITVPGNHDDVENNDSLYFKYFGNTTNQMDTYYAFNWSNTQFVQMQIANGGDCDQNANERNTRAYAWLNETLERGMGQQYRVLMFHRNIYSTYGNDVNLLKYMVPIIEKYNVSLCLYGHQHEYERFYSNGHTYLLIGGGGGLQNANMKPQEITQRCAMGAFFVKLGFTKDGVTVDVYSPTYDLMDHIYLEDVNGMLIPDSITPYGGV